MLCKSKYIHIHHIPKCVDIDVFQYDSSTYIEANEKCNKGYENTKLTRNNQLSDSYTIFCF